MYGYVDSFLSLFQLQLPDAAQVLLAQQLGDQTIQRTHPVIQSVIGMSSDTRLVVLVVDICVCICHFIYQ